MLVQGFLEDAAYKFPDKPAVIFESQRISYRDLDLMANRLANALIAGGVHRGDRVVIYLGNMLETAVAIYAALKAGAVFVVLNPGIKADKLAYILMNCQATALVSHANKDALLLDVCPNIPSLQYLVIVGKIKDSEDLTRIRVDTYETIQKEGNSTRPECKNIDVDLAALIYTSGTTGAPKGVMATHHNMVAAATSIITYLDARSEDIVISVMPLSFDYGLYQLLMACKVGATLVLERGFVYPHAVLQRIVAEHVTGFPGVPTVFATLLQLDGLDQYDFSNLRYLTNTAASLPVEHIRRLRQLFPSATLFSMYGLTECKRVAYLPPEQLDRRPDSVGVAIPNTEVWVVDQDGNRLGPNVVGELVVRGSHVTRGYWQDPDLTAEKFRPGPIPGETILYTGDLFRMDEDGFLYFVSRKDDIIKSRGEKVSPKEVENILYALPGVAEAVVTGVPHEIYGQAVKAYIVQARDANLTAQDVIRHCRRYLEEFMVPALVEFRDQLPKSDSGKFLRSAL